MTGVCCGGEECAVFSARVCHSVLVALAIELRLTIPRPNITSPYSVGSLFIVCVKKLGRQIFFGSDKKRHILGLDSFLQISDAHE